MVGDWRVLSAASTVAAICVGTAGGSGVIGSDVTPSPTPNWADTSGVLVASTNIQQIQGINAPVSLTTSWTGLGGVSIFVNGVQTILTNPGTVVVHNNDNVGFQAFNTGTSGTVTVKNASDSSVTLDTFTYAIYSFTFGPPLPS